MRAVYLEGPEAFAVIEREAPRPAAGEAVVRMVMTGICASDLSLIAGSNPVARLPLTPGHECIGIVEEAPAGAPVVAGDWVVVFPSIGCGHCGACLAGRVNHCPTFEVLGLNRDSGCFAERMAVPVGQLLAVPEGLRRDESALIEPTAVAVHVHRRGATRPGESVLVVGAGVIGTLTALVVRAAGAGPIVMVDRFDSRGELCRRLGLEHFLLADNPHLAAAIRDRAGAIDVVYDTVAVDSTIDLGLDVLAPGGRLVLVATPKSDAVLRASFPKLYRRELSLITSRNYVEDDFREAMRLLATGAFDPSPLITATFPLERFAEAIAALRQQPERHVKVLIDPRAP